jgi:hypothetical protein
MARHRGVVLVDTNVILECWRVNAWRALAGGYALTSRLPTTFWTAAIHLSDSPEANHRSRLSVSGVPLIAARISLRLGQFNS